MTRRAAGLAVVARRRLVRRGRRRGAAVRTGPRPAPSPGQIRSGSRLLRRCGRTARNGAHVRPRRPIRRRHREPRTHGPLCARPSEAAGPAPVLHRRPRRPREQLQAAPRPDGTWRRRRPPALWAWSGEPGRGRHHRRCRRDRRQRPPRRQPALPAATVPSRSRRAPFPLPPVTHLRVALRPRHPLLQPMSPPAPTPRRRRVPYHRLSHPKPHLPLLRSDIRRSHRLPRRRRCSGPRCRRRSHRLPRRRRCSGPRHHPVWLPPPRRPVHRPDRPQPLPGVSSERRVCCPEWVSGRRLPACPRHLHRRRAQSPRGVARHRRSTIRR